MTQFVPALNKVQPQTKTVAVQSNYAAASDQDAAQQDYVDLLAGVTQQSMQQSAQPATADSPGDTDTTEAELLTETALAETALTNIAVAEIAMADVPPAPIADTAAQLSSDGSTDTAAALNLSYSFAAERSVFYSSAQANNTVGAMPGNNLNPAANPQSNAVAAAAMATLAPTEPPRQLPAEPMPQAAQQNMVQHQSALSQTALPLQGTSLQQFIRQALGSLQQQDNSPAAVSGAAATATPTGSTAASGEAALSWKADLAGLQSSQWGQKLVYLLSDKINLQLGQQIQRAQIRLDPPQLGVIELSVSVDGDRTSVQLYAANSQVREAMQQNLDQLRQQLAQRLGADQNLQLDVRDQAQQQTKQHHAVSPQIATHLADDAAELSRAAAVQQTTGWLDRLV